MAAAAIRSIAARAARSSRTSSRRPALRSLLEQLLRLEPVSLGDRGEFPQQLVLRRVDVLGGDDRRDHCLTTQRGVSFGLHLSEDVGLLTTRDLQICLAGDAAV